MIRNASNKCAFLNNNFPIWLAFRRKLNVLEHKSYTLLREAGIPVPEFGIAQTKSEAGAVAKRLNTRDMVVKAQVLTGGRGKGYFKSGFKSGVRPCTTPEEAEMLAGRMLGDFLVTKQTGEAGRICDTVMIIERKYPRREFYFAYMMERAFDGPILIASSQGGMNIEEVAAENPDAIVYEPIDVKTGVSEEVLKKVADKIGLEERRVAIADVLTKLYNLFITTDALLIEINPFAEDVTNKFFCLDCKMRFDDNAEFRQKELFALKDLSQVDPKEIHASKFNLNYIALDGNIGCLVNGAGLAMATMDIIQLHGGNPANFLDVGGSATADQVKEAFNIITADPKVYAILVNIFGGIMRCDIIAEGIVEAAAELDLKVPIVCRLQGTKVDEAKRLLATKKMKIFPCDDFDDAAKLSVKLATIIGLAREMDLNINFFS